MEKDLTNKLEDLIAKKIKKQYKGDGTPRGDWPSEARKGYITWKTFFMELAILTKERSTHRDKVNKINLCTIIIIIRIYKCRLEHV